MDRSLCLFGHGVAVNHGSVTSSYMANYIFTLLFYFLYGCPQLSLEVLLGSGFPTCE